jgi:hypothetical protein
MVSRELKRETPGATWRDRVVELRRVKPALINRVGARSMQATNDRDNDPTRQGEAMAPLFEGVTGKIAIIVDTPQSKYDVPACISSNRDNVRRCETARDGCLQLAVPEARAGGGEGDRRDDRSPLRTISARRPRARSSSTRRSSTATATT